MEWITGHWIYELVFGLVTLLLGILNRALGAGSPRTWLEVLVDLFALFPRPGNTGLLGPINVPGIPSKPKDGPSGGVGGTLALLIICLSVSGCATTKSAGEIAGGVIHVGPDALKCGGTLYNEVREAIKDGGSSWLDIIMAGIACVPGVVRDMRAVFAVEDYPAMASADPRMVPLQLSPDARVRLGIAEWMAAGVLAKVQP